MFLNSCCKQMRLETSVTGNKLLYNNSNLAQVSKKGF